MVKLQVRQGHRNRSREARDSQVPDRAGLRHRAPDLRLEDQREELRSARE